MLICYNYDGNMTEYIRHINKTTYFLNCAVNDQVLSKIP